MLRPDDIDPPHAGRRTMDWKLELVPIRVTYGDRAEVFYTE